MAGFRAVLGAVRITLVTLVLCGLLFPLAVVGVGQLAFRHSADGSLLSGVGGRVVGSAHIGQSFTGPGWFWGRPSATTNPATGKPEPYAANNSGGSNLGPTNAALRAEVKANLQAFLAADPGVQADQVPLDLLESSGSGLDPDITPRSALIQVPRVARATGLAPATLDALVRAHTSDGLLVRLFGAAHVNVLRLNLALVALETRR